MSSPPDAVRPGPRALDPESPVRRTAVLVVLAAVVALLVALDVRLPVPSLAVGDVADRDVTAAEALTFVNAEATASRQAEAEAGVLPVYRADLAVPTRLQSQVSQAFDLARRRRATLPTTPDPAALAALRADFVAAVDLALDPADVDALAAAGWSREAEDVTLELVGVAMRRHVIADRGQLPSPPRPVTLLSELGDTREESVLEDYGAVRTPEEARQAVSLHALERFSGPGARSGPRLDAAVVAAASGVARAAVTPNVTPDPAETASRRAAARQQVPPVEQRVQRGTRVVRAGDAVTAQQVALLEALRAAEDRGSGLGAVAAAFGFLLALLGNVVAFAQATIRKFAARGREREAMGFVLVLVLGIGRLLVEAARALDLGAPFDVAAAALLVPVAGGAMLVS
jgi:membrane-associated HD superfamily phosphohydrolase